MKGLPTTNGFACSGTIYDTSQNYLVEFGAVGKPHLPLGVN